MSIVVEICVQGILAVEAAHQGGADRIELCENLAVGGVTPSAGLIAVACAKFDTPIHVLIRARGGDFLYSEQEMEVMARDVELARSLGASGVVFGALTPEGSIHRAFVERIIDAARPLPLTFHRAFDEVASPLESLQVLMDLGVSRILTAGGVGQAIMYQDQLAKLQHTAEGRVAIAAGGGVTEVDIPLLVNRGIRHLHIGSNAWSDGSTNAGRVRHLVATARSALSEVGSNSPDRPV